METKRIRVLGWLCPVLFLAVILWGICSVEAQTIGKTIDKTNYKEYEALLIPSMLGAAQRGEWTFPTGNLDFSYKPSDRFLAASGKNAGKFDIDTRGGLIDKSTGKFPTYNVYGLPFSNIDPKDPKAAEKIMWNQKFMKYSSMGKDSLGYLLCIGKGGSQERFVKGSGTYLYYQGRPPGNAIKNPQGFIFNFFNLGTEPMGLKGQVLMTWEYMDERESTVNVFLPAIRRARKLSAVARSDPAWGTDLWEDGYEMWQGKNTTFGWKLLGERKILAPFTDTHKSVAQEAPDGTIKYKIPLIKWGYNTPGWKGAPWATTNVTYVPRSVWVVEGNPLDPYYNYGKHIFYVDKEVYFIWLREVFDKSGVFWNWAIHLTHYEEGPSGNNLAGIQTDGQPVFDEKMKHATLSFTLPHPTMGTIYMPASRLNSDFFTVSHMLEATK